MRYVPLGLLGFLLLSACSSSDENGGVNSSGGNAGASGSSAGASGGSAGASGSSESSSGSGGTGDSQGGETSQAGASGTDAGVGPDASSDASTDGGMMTAGDPETLADTGLYSDPVNEVLAEDVMPYSPQFQLWSDGATKKRYIKLPPNTKIDTSDMDHWKFPIGTKLWKEFTRDGTRVETRLLWKKTDDPDFGWFMASYEWNAEQTEATRVPAKGRINALGTPHDIPSTGDCKECHRGQPDRVLGFGAIQLSNDTSPTTLKSLKDQGLLSDPPTRPVYSDAGVDAGRVEVDAYVVPGNAQQRAALGLMHANCGHCHNPNGAGYDRNHMETLLLVDHLGSVDDTAVYQTAVNVDLDQDLSMLLSPDVTKRIVPGDPSKSAVYLRMTARDAQGLISMPPIGSEAVDTTGSQLIADWITSLGTPDGG